MKEKKRNFTKSSLVDEVYKRLSEDKDLRITRKKIHVVITEFLDMLREVIIKGAHVELRRFGTFGIKRQNPRKARNPRTNEPIDLPARMVPYFKPSKSLKEKVISQNKVS